jgi:hypothetical protein
MPSSLRFRLAVPAVLLLALAPVALHGQSHAQLVWNQLQERHNALIKDNYRITRYLIGSLNDSGTDTWTMHFTAGRTYTISGACDADCRDIDIEVTDLNGRVIVSDTQVSDLPQVSFDVNGSGDLKVKITMYQCSENPCFWGLGIWNRQR